MSLGSGSGRIALQSCHGNRFRGLLELTIRGWLDTIYAPAIGEKLEMPPTEKIESPLDH
jgi:hypothetical protein